MNSRSTLDRATLLGLGLVAVSAVVYWLCDRAYDAGRGDLFYLADAFLHGRTWLEFQPGPYDVIIEDGRFYVPFAPFPAIALMPVVAVLGAIGADQVESGINALLAASGVGSVLDAAGPHRRPAPHRPPVAGAPVRLLDPDPVGHDPGRGVAHGTPRGDDPDVRLPDRAVGPAAGVADRPACGSGVPDAGRRSHSPSRSMR